MIIKEYLNDETLIKQYSDLGMMIERDGVRYSEAIDPVGLGREYIETDEPIEKPEEEEELVEEETEGIEKNEESIE